MNEDWPQLKISGGVASGCPAPGDARLLIDDAVHTEGAVAVHLSGTPGPATVVSQGCRPIGEPLVITQAERNEICQLGGRAALLQLKEIFDRLPTRDQQAVQSGLHIGRVVNEYLDEFQQGDFLIRNVMGIDPESGRIAVGDYFRAGQTVQFQIRDETSADAEMAQLLAAAARDGSTLPAAGLLFSCNGRGTRMFSVENHDADLIKQKLGDIPLAGFFAAGEIGPVGGKNYLHGFTASLLLFQNRANS
jgi:small ligand-binding sensory domain FIST